MNLLALTGIAAAAPLAAGAAATRVLGKKPRHPAGPVALVVHSLQRRSRIDCSYVSPNCLQGAIETLLAGERSFSCVRDNHDTHSVCLTFDDGVANCHELALPILSRLNIRATFFPVAGLVGKTSAKADVYGAQRYLSAAQLRSIAELGHEIGSHSLTHTDLARLSESDLRRELADSRSLLQDIIGQSITSISFPYGSWNAHVWNVAMECGYERATAYRGWQPLAGVMPSYGTYSFDTPHAIARRISASPRLNVARAQGRIMSQFSRGTALWQYRPEYHRGGKTK